MGKGAHGFHGGPGGPGFRGFWPCWVPLLCDIVCCPCLVCEMMCIGGPGGPGENAARPAVAAHLTPGFLSRDPSTFLLSLAQVRSYALSSFP